MEIKQKDSCRVRWFKYKDSFDAGNKGWVIQNVKVKIAIYNMIMNSWEK